MYKAIKCSWASNQKCNKYRIYTMKICFPDRELNTGCKSAESEPLDHQEILVSTLISFGNSSISHKWVEKTKMHPVF